MEESIGISMSTAVGQSVAVISCLLLLPVPFLWPWRLARKRKHFPHRGLFCLAMGLLSYLVIFSAIAVLVAFQGLLIEAGFGSSISKHPMLDAFFDYGWIIVVALIMLVSVWVGAHFADRWRDLIARRERH